MDKNEKHVVGFDLYDTLLSTASISEQLTEYVGQEKAERIAISWRTWQLMYLWRLNSLNRFDTYDSITRNALTHTLAEAQISLSQEQIETLMRAYDSLSPYPDVIPALARISQSPVLRSVVFSNGQQSMVRNSVLESKELASVSNVFEDIVTVDEVRKYKPTPDVYHYLVRKVGKQIEQANQVWLVSGNSWDITGAKNAGLNTAWVDRKGLGWTDKMVPDWRPTVQAEDLDQLMVKIEEFVKGSGA